MAQIAISGLRKLFGKSCAVDGVDLVVADGEVMKGKHFPLVWSRN